mgnify:CR=1 FL=1
MRWTRPRRPWPDWPRAGHRATHRRPTRSSRTPLQTLAPIRPSPRSLFPFWMCLTPSSPWPSSIPWPLPSPPPRIAPGAPPASAASSTLKNTSRVPLLRPDRVVPLLCTANAIAGIRRLRAFPEHTMHTYRLTVSSSSSPLTFLERACPLGRRTVIAET